MLGITHTAGVDTEQLRAFTETRQKLYGKFIKQVRKVQKGLHKTRGLREADARSPHSAAKTVLTPLDTDSIRPWPWMGGCVHYLIQNLEPEVRG